MISRALFAKVYLAERALAARTGEGDPRVRAALALFAFELSRDARKLLDGVELAARSVAPGFAPLLIERDAKR